MPHQNDAVTSCNVPSIERSWDPVGGKCRARHLTLAVASGTAAYVIRADEWFLKRSAKCFCGAAVKRAVALSAPFKALFGGFANITKMLTTRMFRTSGKKNPQPVANHRARAHNSKMADGLRLKNIFQVGMISLQRCACLPPAKHAECE